MVIVYRGVLEKPIAFSESLIITSDNLDLIDFDKVIYCEISPIGAMGNEGGIIIYLLSDEDSLVTYETNAFSDQKSYDSVLELIKKNENIFVGYSGGFGNHVCIKKGVQLEIDEKYNCFWYHSENTKLRIDSSVRGVFDSVVAEMKSKVESISD